MPLPGQSPQERFVGLPRLGTTEAGCLRISSDSHSTTMLWTGLGTMLSTGEDADSNAGTAGNCAQVSAMLFRTDIKRSCRIEGLCQ